MIKYFLFLLVILGGCKNTERGLEQRIALNLHSEPPSLDPRKPFDITSSLVLKMCFEGLMRESPSHKPMLALADIIEISADKKTYLFHLKESFWSDGTPLIAKDFEVAWKAILSPSFVSESAEELYRIKGARAAKEGTGSINAVGVQAIAPLTLRVELENVCPYFLSLLCLHCYYPIPSHIAEKHPDWAENSGPNYVSNGPFKLTSWRHQDELVLEKNPHYWDADAVILQRIDLHMVSDENTELSLFEQKEIDWAGSPISSLPLDSLQSLRGRGLLFHPIAANYFYLFNTKSFPFDNRNIRRAFSLAINRQEIIENITQGGQKVATGLVSPLIWRQTRNYFQDGDVEEAKRLFTLGLKETALTQEEFPEVTLSYNTMSSHHKIAQAIQQQWQKVLGIKVKLTNLEWKVFLDTIRQHQFQIARMGTVATVDDPAPSLETYRYPSSSLNPTQWSHPRFSALIDEAEKTTDEKHRLELLAQAESLLIDEMPIAPIYFSAGPYLKQPHLKGVILSYLSNIDFKYAYVEP